MRTRNNHQYRYYNRNPQKVETEDCVCRAISTAVGLKYDAVDRLLDMTAEDNECDKLCVCCYHKLLEDVLHYTPTYCREGETVGEVAEMHRDKKIIIRIKGHLTCSIYSTILDIWDCTAEPVDCFWVIE